MRSAMRFVIILLLAIRMEQYHKVSGVTVTKQYADTDGLQVIHMIVEMVISHLYQMFHSHGLFLDRSSPLCPSCSPASLLICLHHPGRDLCCNPCHPEPPPPSCGCRPCPCPSPSPALCPSPAPAPSRGAPSPGWSGPRCGSLSSPSHPCCHGCLWWLPVLAHGCPVAHGSLCCPGRHGRPAMTPVQSRSLGRHGCSPSLACRGFLFQRKEQRDDKLMQSLIFLIPS